ncbi:Catenin alpha-1 [Xenoophorus captivus]|uniref:Catenin alpha-1 n=1 Tax=Xenoophorus captivus TaxID=1517983 RepID=A0ABV0SBE1_9TELE
MLERANIILSASLDYKLLFLTLFYFISLKTPEELDDSDFETEDFDSRSKTSVQTEDDQLIAGQSARVSSTAIMAQLPQEQKAKIAEQVASFQEEKSKLDAEVSKWDDSGNDIIVLAKQMCMIMMEMTDFTRGKGPLKNTSDVISAAKKIAEAGSRMDKLGRTIADLVSHKEPIAPRGDVTYTFVPPNSCS